MPAGIDSGVSVVLACHTEDRWDSLLRAIASATAQEPAPAAVIVAVDHNPALAQRLRAAAPELTVVDNLGERGGASATRNAGAAVATTPYLAFLDDDAVAHPGWLAALIAPLRADAAVVGTGGAVEPIWQAGRPDWFPDEFGWVIGVTYTGMPVETAPIRNVWSENMAVRRADFHAVGGFREDFGKVGATSRPEDTDLCIRMGAQRPDGHWLYVPAALVGHEVPGNRSTFRFFVRRSFWEGRGKVELARNLRGTPALGSERDYLRKTIPLGIVRHLRGGFPARAASVCAGTVAASAGAAVALTQRSA
jgi:GT2 family glycosyltransferase